MTHASEDKDPRIIFVPSREVIKKILDNKRSDKLGKGDTGFRLTVKPVS